MIGPESRSARAETAVGAVLLASLPVADLVRALTEAEAGEGARLLEELVGEEDRLVLGNEMKPYQDKVAPVLMALSPARAQPILDRVAPATLKRALFGNFTRVPDGHLAALLAAMAPDRAARLVDAMVVGIDAPREMARVVSAGASAANGGADLGRALRLVHPVAIVRLLHELDDAAGAEVLRRAGDAQTAAVVAVLQNDGNRVHYRWGEELQASASSAGGCRSPVPVVRNLRSQLEDLAVEEAALLLTAIPSRPAARAVRMMPAARAAKVLVELARRDPALAADLLEAANGHILLRPPQPGAIPAWWAHDCPAAGILAAMDPADAATAALLRSLRSATLEMILDHLTTTDRSRIDELVHRDPGRHLTFDVEITGVARGARRTKALDGGIRWVHIEETLDTGRLPKPVVIDLLEVPLDRVRLSARMAVPDDRALPAAAAAAVFETYRLAGERPSGAAFAETGLTQLSRAVAQTGALAAINGNFYFDYGHYLNGVTLGIDIAHVPGLFFGDPIGWFVAGGEELIPPAFNRAAGLVTDDGSLHIERVFMTDVSFPGRRPVGWEALNVPKASAAGRVVAFTSLFGYQTEPGSSHVDVAIARGRVWEISAHGDQVIPLTGLVLSVPAAHASRLLGAAKVGDAVTVGNDFPASRGHVVEAMACGPCLVRSGSLDVDFVEEDFGQQDSTVMSFFLPRTVETYEAARSFLAIRDGTLLVGTVSGTAYGFGRSGASSGMTFGEMAQLCLDLGVEHAYALDGGGSSSLVARDSGVVRVLNRPTGGADVDQGEERFINTHWLVFAR